MKNKKILRERGEVSPYAPKPSAFPLPPLRWASPPQRPPILP